MKTSDSRPEPRPEPKFVVGELVDVRSPWAPENDVDDATVLEAHYGKKCNRVTGETRVGWSYKVDKQHPTCRVYYHEQSLRKKPPTQTLKWSDCLFHPVSQPNGSDEVIKEGEAA